MGFECNKSQIQHFLVQNKIVGQEKNKYVQNGVKAPAGSIPETLQRENLSKRGIKKINNRNDHLFWHNPQIPAQS